jgi:hypothetical protein
MAVRVDGDAGKVSRAESTVPDTLDPQLADIFLAMIGFVMAGLKPDRSAIPRNAFADGGHFVGYLALFAVDLVRAWWL